MGTSSLKETFVASSLYEAFRDQQIPTDPRLIEFSRLHEEFDRKVRTTSIGGMMVVPAVTLYFYRKRSPPSVAGGLTLGVLAVFLVWIIPNRPTVEEMNIVRQVAPRHWEVLVKKEPKMRKVFEEVLGPLPNPSQVEPSVNFSHSPGYIPPVQDSNYVYGSLSSQPKGKELWKD